MKETVTVPEKQKYAFVLNFEYLFFLEDKKLLQENSNLVFKSQTAAPIDLEMTMEKINLFKSMKNF